MAQEQNQNTNMDRRGFAKAAAAAAAAVSAAATAAPLAAQAQATKSAAGGGAKGFKVANPSKGKPGDYEQIQCDQVGIDYDGKPMAVSAPDVKHDPAKPHKMKLTKEEQDILDGKKGDVLAKVLKTVVMHGELFGAERLEDCGGAPHSSLYTAGPWITPTLEMFEKIADAGLKAHAPYTVNPLSVDLYTMGQDPTRRNMMLEGNPLQGRLIQAHTRLGARPLNNWSCACYVPEVNNVAEPGTAVSWAESSAVNYGNSVLGLRINRMATGMEILCGIVGKVPVFGMLTEEGRKATWKIEVKLSKEPHWGAVGGAIGAKVVDKVPYVTGIDKWIPMKDGKPDSVAMGKLKAMGSGTASSGAVGLYHVDKVTPEAIDQGEKLLTEDHQTYVIDDAELAKVMGEFENRWKDPKGDPTAVYLGCPHNTYDEILYWAQTIDKALKEKKQEKVSIPVYMGCSHVVRNRLLDEHPVLLRDVIRGGVQFINICLVAVQGLKGMADIDRGVTNSGKARFYSALRLFGDEDLLNIALTGKLPA